MTTRFLALLFIIIISPLFIIIGLLIILTSKGGVFFKQKRLGKNKKVFTIYKFRTMVNNAEKLKSKYNNLNQASGPTFKIYNDPRFTRIGKLLSRVGIDELPQLYNILIGEMAFVGPRPLPVNEAKLIPHKYEKRFSVLPGITSLWVVQGAHQMRFDEWMKSDIWYINHKSLLLDMKIMSLTIWVIMKWCLQRL